MLSVTFDAAFLTLNRMEIENLMDAKAATTFD